MKYVLEVFYRGDCIDRKEYPEPIILPRKGEQIYISFENKTLSYGSWWIVRKRKYLMFTQLESMQTVQLFCEPDPEQGA
jgi:hypothetical protein